MDTNKSKKIFDYIIPIIIASFIIYFLINNNSRYNKIETYDDRYRNATIDKCSDFCKKTTGCFGFAYDKKTNTCYPSQSIIDGRPIDAIHEDAYSPENTVCNKFDPIEIPDKAPPFDKRRSNSLFICSEKEGLQPQQYFHNNDKLIKLDEGQNLDFITDVDAYRVRPYRWPRSKYDNEQLDILIDYRKKQLLDPEYITQLSRIEQPYIEPEEQEPEEIRVKVADLPQVFRTAAQDTVQTLFNLPTQKEFDLVTDEEIDKVLLPPEELEKKNIYKLYKIYHDKNQGEYLKKHKCVSSISLKNCLTYCSQDQNCNGVEWNPKFYDYNNVCCPIRKLGQFVPRENSYRYGRFYLKNYKDNVDRAKTYLYHMNDNN